MSHYIHRLQAAIADLQYLPRASQSMLTLRVRLSYIVKKIDVVQITTENVTRNGEAASADANGALTPSLRPQNHWNNYKAVMAAIIQRTEDDLWKTYFVFHEYDHSKQINHSHF